MLRSFLSVGLVVLAIFTSPFSWAGQLDGVWRMSNGSVIEIEQHGSVVVAHYLYVVKNKEMHFKIGDELLHGTMNGNVFRGKIWTSFPDEAPFKCGEKDTADIQLSLKSDIELSGVWSNYRWTEYSCKTGSPRKDKIEFTKVADRTSVGNCKIPMYTAATAILKKVENPSQWFMQFMAPFLEKKAVKWLEELVKGTPAEIEVKLAEKATDIAADAYKLSKKINDLQLTGVLKQTIVDNFRNQRNFDGLTTEVAELMYQPVNSSVDMDFSKMCFAPYSSRAKNDTMSMTVYSVTKENCESKSLLNVFPSRLINGSVNGVCQEDAKDNSSWFSSSLGINSVTYLCPLWDDRC